MKREEIWKAAVHTWRVGAEELSRLSESIDRDALTR